MATVLPSEEIVRIMLMGSSPEQIRETLATDPEVADILMHPREASLIRDFTRAPVQDAVC